MPNVILLVDDSEIVIESVRRWLKRDGYDVIIARNCAEARAAAVGRRFAGHIVDLQLSDGQGVELALWLKSEGHSAETIFYTGHSPGSDALERAQRVGRVVTKGADPSTLLRALGGPIDPTSSGSCSAAAPDARRGQRVRPALSSVPDDSSTGTPTDKCVTRRSRVPPR